MAGTRASEALATASLAYAPPFEWSAALAFLAARAVNGVEQVDGETYRRTVRLGTDVGIVAVRPAESGPALRVTVTGTVIRRLAEVENRLRSLFDLDADLEAIGRHLSGDPALAPMVAARPAVRVYGGWDGFEVAVRAVIGQQVTVTHARRLNARLVERCGPRLSTDLHGLTWIFPSPADVVSGDLSAMGMPAARVSTLRRVAEAALEDPALFASSGCIEDTVSRLRRIKGIGDWTAHYIAMRACREPDAFPAGDVGLLRGAAGPAGVRPLPAALLARAERWRPWRAYAAHHLWAADTASSQRPPLP